jgi:UDP-N-acetylmuramate-alanine ligase
VTSALLGEAIRRRGAEVADVYTVAEIVGLLESELCPGDVLIAMGAGDVDEVCDAFTRRLPRHRRAG